MHASFAVIFERADQREPDRTFDNRFALSTTHLRTFADSTFALSATDLRTFGDIDYEQGFEKYS
jgi:hypothetical protein